MNIENKLINKIINVLQEENKYREIKLNIPFIISILDNYWDKNCDEIFADLNSKEFSLGSFIQNTNYKNNNIGSIGIFINSKELNNTIYYDYEIRIHFKNNDGIPEILIEKIVPQTLHWKGTKDNLNEYIKNFKKDKSAANKAKEREVKLQIMILDEQIKALKKQLNNL